MDILTILIIAVTLFAFPLGEFARVDFGNGIAFTFLDIGVAVIALFYIGRNMLSLRIAMTSFLRTVPKSLAVFLGVAGISLLLNLWWLSGFQRWVSFLYLVRFGLYASLLIILKHDKNKKHQIFIRWSFFIAGGAILLVGFVQYFFYPSLANLKYAGWDQHLYRLFSTFLDPNFTGAFLVLYFLFCGDWLLHVKKILEKFLLIVVEITTLLAIFLTYSRAAYLMLIVGTISYLWLKGYKKWIVTTCIVGILIGILVLGLVQKKSEGTNLFRTVSTFARVGNAQNALTIFQRSPLIGIGFDSYRYMQRKYGFVVNDAGHGGAGADNSFLFVLATTGIIGLVAYCGVWWSLLKRGLQKKSYFVVSSMLALFVGSLFNNLLFYPFLMYWIFLLIGITEST